MQRDRRDLRRGLSLVEGLVYLSLALGLVGFLVAAYQFFTVKGAEQSAEAAELRETTIFLERLRRILRFGVVRVVPTAAGLRVIHWSLGADGQWRLVETLFENAGERGRVVITDPDGNRRVYDVGQGEDGELILEAEVDGEVLRITLDGIRVLTQVVTSASTRQKGEPWILRGPDDPGTTLAEVLEELRRRGDGWLELPPQSNHGEGDEGSSDHSGLRDELIEGEAVPTARTLQESLADEADLMGIEASELGQIFLPPQPPPGVQATAVGEIRDRLQAGGLGAAKAEAVAEVIANLEDGVLSGDRRGAGRALSTLVSLAEADGMTATDLGDMIAASSDVGLALAEANPDAVARVDSGQVPETEVPPTLGQDLDDVDEVADLPGEWGDPPLDDDGDDNLPPNDPDNNPPDNFDPVKAYDLCLNRCNDTTFGNPLCPTGCSAAVDERKKNGPISEPCASECTALYEDWACAVFCDMN